jgi:ATP-dependent protease ClpP protease subunit
MAHDSEEEEEEECGENVTVIDNHVFFYGDIDTTTTFKLHCALHLMKKKMELVKNPEIFIHIMTNGGDIFCGFSTYDLIKSFTNVTVTVIVEGCCASAGTLILLAADHRIIRPNGFLLVHHISSTFWGGNFKAFQDEMANMNTITKKLRRIYKRHTLVDEDKLKDILSRDLWFSSKKSKKLGFVDIIE